MNVNEIMTPSSFWAQPTISLVECARAMRERDVGALPLVENDKLVGMVTDRDLVVRGMADGKDPNSSTAREVMTEEAFWCYENTDVSEVAQYMQKNRVRRIPVINQDKRLVGMISIGDITRASSELAGDTLRELSAVGD